MIQMQTFLDVADTDPFWPSIDAAAMNGVTSGCGSGKFCPDLPTSRASIVLSIEPGLQRLVGAIEMVLNRFVRLLGVQRDSSNNHAPSLISAGM